jgi:hypothetical protein
MEAVLARARLRQALGERAMITVDVTGSDTCLRINCAGCYGPRSEGNLLSGRLVQDAIERNLDRCDSAFTEVVIDFTRVQYGAGDGPIWSVMGAVRRGLNVTYLVSERTREALHCLLSTTHMNQFIDVVVVGDGQPFAGPERPIRPGGTGENQS